jgi:hypothetical protein
MRRVRASSFEEFIRWYLGKERLKRGQGQDLSGRSWDDLVREMRRAEAGKLRPWFEDARWSIVSLDDISEAMHLVLVDNWEARQNGLIREGLDNRLARTIVTMARETGYYDNPEILKSNSVIAHFRQERIAAFRKSWPELRDGDRLTICDLNADEKAENPGGTYYLHDGFGRLLAYLYMIFFEGREYGPIEAFLAEEN